MRKLTPLVVKKQVFFLLFAFTLLNVHTGYGQTTYPVNGVADPKDPTYAFTNATIVKDAQTTLSNATMIIKTGKIVSIGTNVTVPKEAITIDCKGKYLYPSFVDIFSDYGMPAAAQTAGGRAGGFGGGGGFGGISQITSNTKGAFGWNQAIKPEVDASKLFTLDGTRAKSFRDVGFGTAMIHQKDGIARGTGAVVTLGDMKENLLMVKEKAAAIYSFNRGTSGQTYPSSLMGCIALLRQTYLDAEWYKSKPATEGTNISLEAWQSNQGIPQIFDAGADKWNDLRADRIGDEFGIQYIIKGTGSEYQRIKEVAATKAPFIVTLNFPQAMDVEDPNDARFVSLEDMKHWEMAPSNPAAMEKANIPFCITSAELRDVKQFMTNLRKAIDYGLTETKAMDALTKTPATLLGVYDKVGSLEAGKLANFIITSGPVFNERTVIFENWVQGEKYPVNETGWNDIKGIYKMTISSPSGTQNYTLDVRSTTAANVIGTDTLSGRLTYEGKMVSLSYSPVKTRGGGGGFGGGGGGGGRGGFGGGAGAAPAGPSIRLSGVVNGTEWNGTGADTAGNSLTWTATYQSAGTASRSDSARRRAPVKIVSKLTYPFDGYGWETLPTQQNMLIKNATVWTNEKEGKLENTDVLVKNGKIVQIGKNLTDASAKVIDATGKHLTAGIIDEHSHIAAASINEGGQSVTSEVRIADNLNPDDINIYRQLAGGVTSSHILHGSANTIGGQTQLIKLRWGMDDDEIKFKGADPFIKFALGENVKRTTSQTNTRFPDTRMGVEEVLVDGFQRAKDYEKALAEKKGPVRRDLELEALLEILNKKRFITCHSYVQSEITAFIRVADNFKFTVNTFTHILEGYKVADKMKIHGSNASTFSDWWAYKVEVQDAIAYNAAIMYQVGLNVCINSDDAEMARRLNQEAAKTVKYGGVPEEDALKMVTLNPAKALHVADRVGSIKAGKDADLVIWSDNPLSIYAKAEKTIVDGTVYYDQDHDVELRKQIASDRNKLIQKMLAEKRSGAPVSPATPSVSILLSCGDHAHHNGLVTIEEGDDDGDNSNQ